MENIKILLHWHYTKQFLFAFIFHNLWRNLWLFSRQSLGHIPQKNSTWKVVHRLIIDRFKEIVVETARNGKYSHYYPRFFSFVYLSHFCCLSPINEKTSWHAPLTTIISLNIDILVGLVSASIFVLGSRPLLLPLFSTI